MTFQLFISICFVLGFISIASGIDMNKDVTQNPYCSHKFRGYYGEYHQEAITKHFYGLKRIKPQNLCYFQIQVPYSGDFFQAFDFLLYIEIRSKAAPNSDKNGFFLPEKKYAEFFPDGNEFVFRQNYLVIKQTYPLYLKYLQYLKLPRTAVIAPIAWIPFLHISEGVTFDNNTNFVFPYTFTFKYFFVPIKFRNTARLYGDKTKRSISDYEAQLVSNQTKRSISANQISDPEHVDNVIVKQVDEPANYLFMMLILLTFGSVIVFLVIKMRKSPININHHSFNAEETSLNLELPLIVKSKI